MLERLQRFSSWFSVKRAIAACLRFKQGLMKGKIKKPPRSGAVVPPKGGVKDNYVPVNVQELQQAEEAIIKMIQVDAFSKELASLRKCSFSGAAKTSQNLRLHTGTVDRNSRLRALDPFLDDHGVIRVGGRIRRANLPRHVKHPMILPKNGHLTQLVVLHHHKRVGNSGRGITLNEIRASGYWIIAARAAVASCLNKCVTCRKLGGMPQVQKMADLPEDRTEPTAPFTFSGVDYVGPFYVRQGRSEVKRYGALFTCQNSRAVHIETSNSLYTDSFLNAYRRFVCRRGSVRQLRSDQGTNFVGAKGELAAALSEMDEDKVRRELLKDHCDWISFCMNAPHSSHKGGVWERMIRSVRSVLPALLATHGVQLDDELLRTLLTEAEAIVNSRPLTYVDMTSKDAPRPLSPSQILTLKSEVVLPPPGIFQRGDLYCRRRWRRVQFLANEFWNRWRKEFLPTLQKRRKWTKEHPNLKKGDIVLVVDDTAPRCRWPLARVVVTFPGSDSFVRTVRVCANQSMYDRSIHKLVLLLEHDTHEDSV